LIRTHTPAENKRPVKLATDIHSKVDESISAQWFQLEESDRPVQSVQPKPVPIFSLPGFDSAVRFWPRYCRDKTNITSESCGSSFASVEKSSEEDDLLDGAEDIDQINDKAEQPHVEIPAEVEVLLAEANASFVSEPEVPPPFQPYEHASASAASSSGGAPGPLAPPPPAAADGPARPPKKRRLAPQVHPELTLHFSTGTIKYYYSNETFEAFCKKHGGRCTLTRNATGTRKADGSVSGGRPLGLLLLWLQRSHSNIDNLVDKDAHTNKKYIKKLSGPACKSLRRQLRARLALRTSNESAFNLLAAERHKSDGEDSEADTCP